MEKTEQELRVELAACYRIFDYLGWTELIYNHITVKLPGNDHHFLINPLRIVYFISIIAILTLFILLEARY